MSGRPSASSASSSSSYVGSELDVFALARNWKALFATALRPYLEGLVVEVGAGLGSTTTALCDGSQRLWLCLEPDLGLLARARRELSLPACCRLVSGLSSAVSPGTRADAILYIDVLEHIEDDRAELTRALGLLAPGGHLLVVSPAHPFLFMPFGEAVGHFRRYQRRSLRAAVPEGFETVRLCYLDSAGFFASLANRLLLRESHPSKRQILFWDRVLVPVSRVVDPLLGYGFGKSVLGIFRKR